MDETSHENEVNRIIGENIRIRRCLKGLSQDALGNAVGVSFQQIQKYEKGMNAVSPARLVQLCRIFSCEIGDFFKGVSSDGMAVPELHTLSEQVRLRPYIKYFERINSSEVKDQFCNLLKAIALLEEQLTVPSVILPTQGDLLQGSEGGGDGL